MKIGHRLRGATRAALLLTLAVLAAASFSLAAAPASLAGPAGWVTHELPEDLEEGCSTLAAIWGSSASEVFVAASCGALLRYDGQAWGLHNPGPLAVPGQEDNPSSTSTIWAANATNIFLGGSGYTDLDGPHAAVYRLGEGGWTAWAVARGDNACINGLWGASASDNIYAVGGDEGGGFIFRWNGADWGQSLSYGADEGLQDVQINGIWGSSASDVFAVGGGIWDSSQPVILHYNGQQWTAAEIGGPWNKLNAVWGSSASDVFAVGVGGTILHYNGSDWVSHDSGTEADLTAVWGSSASDVFAAGRDAEAGTTAILYYNGLTWTPVSDVTREGDLRGLWGSSASDVFAVGEAGTILHYGSTASTDNGPVPAPAPETPAGDPGEAPAAPAQPLIAALQADSGRPGEDLTVTITGANLDGATTVEFGSGITVNQVTVISDTEIAAGITIDGVAAAGGRTVVVTTPRGVAMMPGGFVVQEAGPTARPWVHPLSAAIGAAAALGAVAVLWLVLRRRPAR